MSSRSNIKSFPFAPFITQNTPLLPPSSQSPHLFLQGCPVLFGGGVCVAQRDIGGLYSWARANFSICCLGIVFLYLQWLFTTPTPPSPFRDYGDERENAEARLKANSITGATSALLSTVSLGLVCFAASGLSYDQLVAADERAITHAALSGLNQVIDPLRRFRRNPPPPLSKP